MQLTSVLRCPHCGFEKEETMPVDACVVFYTCAHCGQMIRPKADDCCIFCSYGTEQCPAMQAQPTLTQTSDTR